MDSGAPAYFNRLGSEAAIPQDQEVNNHVLVAAAKLDRDCHALRSCGAINTMPVAAPIAKWSGVEAIRFAPFWRVRAKPSAIDRRP